MWLFRNIPIQMPFKWYISIQNPVNNRLINKTTLIATGCADYFQYYVGVCYYNYGLYEDRIDEYTTETNNLTHISDMRIHIAPNVLSPKTFLYG